MADQLRAMKVHKRGGWSLRYTADGAVAKRRSPGQNAKHRTGLYHPTREHVDVAGEDHVANAPATYSSNWRRRTPVWKACAFMMICSSGMASISLDCVCQRVLMGSAGRSIGMGPSLLELAGQNGFEPVKLGGDGAG
jgi:hypothetical protein